METHGLSMENLGLSWETMDIYGHHAIFFPWTNHGNTWRIHGKMIENPRKSRRFTGDSPATRWHPGHGSPATDSRSSLSHAMVLTLLPGKTDKAHVVIWGCHGLSRIKMMVFQKFRDWNWKPMNTYVDLNSPTELDDGKNFKIQRKPPIFDGKNPWLSGEDFATNPLTEMSYPPVLNDITWFDQETWWYNEPRVYWDIMKFTLWYSNMAGRWKICFFWGGVIAGKINELNGKSSSKPCLTTGR